MRRPPSVIMDQYCITVILHGGHHDLPEFPLCAFLRLCTARLQIWKGLMTHRHLSSWRNCHFATLCGLVPNWSLLADDKYTSGYWLARPGSQKLTIIILNSFKVTGSQSWGQNCGIGMLTTDQPQLVHSMYIYMGLFVLIIYQPG